MKGYTLLETMLVLLLVGIVVAIAMPRLVSVLDAGQQAAQVQWNDVARAALNLDFAKQQLMGGYNGPFKGKPGKKLTGADQKTLESLLDMPLPGAGKWTLVHNGNATQAAEVKFSW